MAFIAYYVNFENPTMMIKFEKEVEQLTGSTTPMGVKEILLDRRKKEGIEQGRQEERFEFVERLIEKLGLSDEQIADVANVSMDFVKKVREELASRK
ncbi:hypothetical protein D3C86_1646540 [compost metagenome]